MIIFNYICLIILLVGIGFLYRRYVNKYKEQEQTNNYDIIKQYLLTKKTNNINENNDSEDDNRPIIWIHVKYDYNSRNWESFQSRSNFNINMPYQNLTIRSIIDKNPEFNICLIDDNSFKNLIPAWNVEINKIGNPVKDYMRTICLLKVLYYYGGIIVPPSFLCLKSLLPLYTNKPFVVENITKCYTGENIVKYMPDITFIGAPPKCDLIKQLCYYSKSLLSIDNTNEALFLGDQSKWLLEKVKSNEILLIDGNLIGIKNNKNKAITCEDLVNTKPLLLHDYKLLGIYIPEKEFLNRNAVAWFSSIKENELLESNMAISKYFISCKFNLINL